LKFHINNIKYIISRNENILNYCVKLIFSGKTTVLAEVFFKTIQAFFSLITIFNTFAL